MNVKELIDILQRIPDKEVKLVIDCPHCGAANEIKKVTEVVTIGGREDR